MTAQRGKHGMKSWLFRHLRVDKGVLLDALLDRIEGNLYFKDLDSRFVLINRKLADALKMKSPADAVGKSDFDFFTEEHASPAYEDEQEIIRSGCPLLDHEEKETWPDGRVTWVSTSKWALCDKSGRAIGTFGISRDVTESHVMREALVESETHLASASEQLTELSQSMVARAADTATLADFLEGAGQEVSAMVASVSAAATQVSASIREISKSANDSAGVAERAVDLAESANASMRHLEASSREIQKVLKAISSIAKQTNLLSLNASIEAARAGEAGKGFAVVANEVMDLATQTARATEEIGRTMEAIQTSTTEAASSFERMGTIIGSINEISGSIASAVEEQTATTKEIGGCVSDAAEKIGEMTKKIGGVAASAKQTTKGAESTREAALELGRLASRLRASLTGSFQTS